MGKYRIGLTIKSEALFAMIAKFLPVDDFDVVELNDRPQPQPQIKQSRVAQLIAAQPEKRKSHKPHGTPFRHPSGKVLTDFVTEFMEKNKGDVAWADLGRYAESLGFARSSINNAVSRLLEKGTLEKRGVGIYGLKKKVAVVQK